MRARYKILCDHSIGMLLAAIETYNKPTFPQREQVFAILVVNAFESLFKAKLVKDANGRLNCLYVKDGRRYKRSKSGRHLTIDIGTAMNRCAVPEIVGRSLSHLIETRNAATHLTAESKFLPVLTFTLGTAALRNYSVLVNQWFGLSLAEYEFFILPMGFRYPFNSLSLADLKGEPDEIRSIMEEIHIDQQNHAPADGFHLICEVSARVVSAKKLLGDADLTVSIDPNAPDAAILTPIKLTDRYPYRYNEVYARVKQECPNFKQSDLNEIIRANNVKDRREFSAYNFNSKSLESKGPTKNTTVIYNDDFVQFCIAAMQIGTPES